MGTRNFFDDEDAYRDLPGLRKPLPRIKVMRRAADDDLLSSADHATKRAPVRRAPPSTGDNPYLNLPPDAVSVDSRKSKGTRG